MNWTLCTLGELAEIEMGQSPKGIECNSEGQGTPLLNGPTEFGSHHPLATQFTTNPKRFSKPDDILFCVRGSTTGKMNWSDKGYAIGRGLAAFRHKEGPEYKNFLRGIIDLKLPELLASATGSTFPNVSKHQIHGLLITVPPLPEQKAIAHVLGSLDDKIELNRKMNQTLEAMAQALFKSWFVDFDPVIDNALEAGIPIPDVFSERAERRKKLKKGGLVKPLPDRHLFPDAFEFSDEMGWIPEGWIARNFGEVSLCFDKTRIPLSKKQRATKKPGAIPYHGATSVIDFINEFIFNDIYLLIGEDGSVIKENGRPFLQYIWGESWVNNHAHVLQGAETVSTEMLMLFMNEQNMRAYITGAVQLKINQKNMNSIPFVFADEIINSAFNKIIQRFFEKIRSLTDENDTLSKLRDTLLPKLLSGEIRIPDVEKFVENFEK